MAELVNFNIPIVGRLTHGSLTELRTKDHLGAPLTADKQHYNIGVAYPKAQFWQWLTTEFYSNVLSKALAPYPHAVGLVNAWFQNGLNGFSMKIEDGDMPNQRGQVNENTKGHFVVWFRAGRDMAVQTRAGETSPSIEISADQIKRGYYVQIAGSIKFNEKTGQQIGIYMNMGVVWLRAVGPIIAGSVDAEAAFAGAAAPLPMGAAAYDPTGGAAAAFAAPGGYMPQPAAAPAPGGYMPQPAAGFTTGAPAPNPAAFAAAPGAPAAPGVQPSTAYPPYHGAMQPPQQ